MKNSSLIFGLMSAFDKKEFSTADLMHLLIPFKITESCLRTNLSRMSNNNLLISRRVGKKVYYRFSKKARIISSNVALNFKYPDWSGWKKEWWGVVFSVPEVEKSERYKIKKKLVAYRFAPLYPGFWIRPLNETEKIGNRLENTLMTAHCKIIQFYPTKDIRKDEVIDLWKLDKINDDFKIGLETLRRKEEEIGAFSPEQACIEKMVVGDEIVNFLFKDPLLPDQFLPDNWMGEKLRNEFHNWDKEVTRISKPYWGKIFETTTT